MTKPPCEVCGTHKYTYEEFLFLDEDDPENGEFGGLYACPDCVGDIFIGINPITRDPMVKEEN